MTLPPPPTTVAGWPSTAISVTIDTPRALLGRHAEAQQAPKMRQRPSPHGASRLSVHAARRSLARPQLRPRASHGTTMMRRYLRQLGLVVLLVLPRSAAIAQSGRFDLEKTKTVLTGLIE